MQNGNDLSKLYKQYKSKLDSVSLKIEKRFDWIIKNRFEYIPKRYCNLDELNSVSTIEDKLYIILLTEENYIKSTTKQLNAF